MAPEKEQIAEKEHFAAHAPRNLIGKQMLAGATAGSIADAITYPMMTVKSRLQVQGGGGSPYNYTGPVNALTTIPTRTLYKGFATLALIFPAQALYLGTYQSAKKILPGGESNPTTQFCSGIVATFVQSSIMVPIEVIRSRQMVAPEGMYNGSVHTVRTLYSQEGIVSLYRGFWLGQMVWGPYNAVYLPLWETLKGVSLKFSGAESMQQLPIQYEAGSAFCAAAVASGLTNPADIVKTRLQTQAKSSTGGAPRYTGALDAAQKIYAKEGFGGFTKGMSSRVFWVAPTATIMFTTYDQLLKKFNNMWP